MDEEHFRRMVTGTIKKLIANGELQIEVTSCENELETNKYLKVKLYGEELYSKYEILDKDDDIYTIKEK